MHLTSRPTTSPSTRLERQFVTRASQRGVTLIELVTVLSIVAVLAAASIPMAGVAHSVKTRAAANLFMSNLNLARSEAIKRRTPVVLCKSIDGKACSTSGGWHHGWITFHDANSNALLDTGEAVISRTEAIDASLQFMGNLQVANYVSFSSTGATRMASGAFQAGTLTVCRRSLESVTAKQVVLSATGRSRINTTSMPSCA